MRSPAKMGDINMVDTMVCDGLMDAFHDYHMGVTGLFMFLCSCLRKSWTGDEGHWEGEGVWGGVGKGSYST